MATGFDDFESTAVDATPSNLTTFGAQTAVVKADGTASNGKHLLITRTSGGGSRGVRLDDFTAAFVSVTDTKEIVAKIRNISGAASDNIEVYPSGDTDGTTGRKFGRVDADGTAMSIVERSTERGSVTHGLTLTDWWIIRVRASKTTLLAKIWAAGDSEPAFTDVSGSLGNNDDMLVVGSICFPALAAGRAIAVDWYGWATEGDTAPMSAEAGDPPAGTVTISNVAPGSTTAVVTYSYNDTDEDSFEYRIDGGAAAAIGTSPATITGLTANTVYNTDGIQVRAINAHGEGAWSTATALTTDTAATLTSPTGVKTGATTATGTVVTDEASGTLYAYVSTSETPPSATDLKAGTGAAWSGNQAVSTVGTKQFDATGLSGNTTYYYHFLHTDATPTDSSISTSASFTTDPALVTEWFVVVTLIDPADDTPRVSLSSLHYVVYDGMPWDDPPVLLAGSDGTTDGSGEIEIIVDEPTEITGVLWLLVSNSDGDPATASWSTAHPVDVQTREVEA